MQAARNVGFMVGNYTENVNIYGPRSGMISPCIDETGLSIVLMYRQTMQLKKNQAFIKTFL